MYVYVVFGAPVQAGQEISLEEVIELLLEALEVKVDRVVFSYHGSCCR